MGSIRFDAFKHSHQLPPGGQHPPGKKDVRAVNAGLSQLKKGSGSDAPKLSDAFQASGSGRPQALAPKPPVLGLEVNAEKGTVKGLLQPYTLDGQRVIDFNGVPLPVPTGGKPEALPVSDNQVITLTPRADGLVEVNTRTVGLESDKKDNKFKGTLLADDTGKLDIGGKEIDVSGMKPGKTKTKTLKIKGKKYKVKVRMNADGTFHVEGKRKRGLFGSIANFVGGVLNKVMPVLSLVSMAIPGMQWLGVASKVWGAIQGGIGAVKSFASGNILGGLASLAGAVAGGAKALGAKAFASVAEKVSQTLSWVQTGFNTLKNGFKALGSGDILGGLAGIASTIAGGAGVVGKWATGAVQATAEKLGGLFDKISGSLSAVKDGINVFKNGLSALKNGDLLGGLASIASSLAGGAKVVGGWAQGQVQKVATEIGSVLGKVANTLGLGKTALQGVKAGLAALGTGRLAEGVSLVFGALATGATAASDWTRGQASKAVENLSKLFSNVSAGAAQVQGLMDAVKSRNPSAILQALAGALGFSAGVVNQGAGKTAELLQNISAWLGRAGNIAADPKAGLVNLLQEFGPRILQDLFSAGDPKPAVAGAPSGDYKQIVSDMDGLGGYLPVSNGEVLIASAGQIPPHQQSMLERVTNFFKGFGLGAWETFQALGKFATNVNNINPILVATGTLADLITGKSPGQAITERGQRAQASGRALLNQTRALMELAWDLSNPGQMVNFFNMTKAIVNELRSLPSNQLNDQRVSQAILKHTSLNPSVQATKSVLDALTNYRAVVNSGGSPEEIGKAAFRIFSLLAPLAKAKVANRPPPAGSTRPSTPPPPPRPAGPFHSLSSLPGMGDITRFALGRLRGANGRAIPPNAMADTVLYRGTSANFVRNNTIGVNPKGTGAYVMPDGSIKLASEVHASFEGGAGASYFSTNPNYARNYARQNGGVVVEVRLGDLQQMAHQGKVVLAPDSAGSQHLVVLGRPDTRIPVRVSQP
jgi:hypothetical protein